MQKVFKKGDRACGNCAFFDKFPEQKKPDNVLGACKANPPAPALDTNDSKLGVWPLVLGHFWCGIFEDNKEDK